jgi:uncharacterized protein (DUF58 family)
VSVVPTRRLALVVLALGVVLAVAPVPLPSVWAVAGILAAVAVLLAVGDALAAVRPGALTLERHHPPVVVAGTTATLEWVVRSDATRSVRLLVADELAPSLQAAARRFDVRVPAGDVVRVSTPFQPMRRGRFELARVAIRIVGPLGLGSRQREVPLASVLRVHPPFRSRDDAELAIRRGRILEVGLRSARGLGTGTEFEQLREYGPDDEFRRIDWTATARAGRPIVRTFRAERNQTVVAVLDTGRVTAGRVAGVPRLEHAVDAVTALGEVATRLGDRCGLVAFGRGIRAEVPPARRRDQVGRLTEAMYALEPELSESDYPTAFRHVLVRYRRRAMLVVLSDLLEPAVEDSLLPALPLVTRTHLVVVAGVRDPEVEAWAHGPADDPESVHRRAAATTALADRRRTAARLRGLGVTVVDAAPGHLARELADAYLLAKQTGRL